MLDDLILVSFSETFDQVFKHFSPVWFLILENHSFLQDFKQDMLVGRNFSKILLEGTRMGDSMFCGSSVGELVEAGQLFLNELQK